MGRRLEVARDKVWGRRDAVGVCGVYESMCKGYRPPRNQVCCALDTGEEESG